MMRDATPSPVIAKGFTNVLTLHESRPKGSLPVVHAGFQIEGR
jgi:hypothetical protein